ncbi:uncharacterized protein LOC120356169 isoform X2 [Nilaparvata lugens]|uniref:uncharacterized protein LOC120356169 isoform X2 n=1 Tax=Nilaparvata lugens TaxID=108931 RepID=UPI00193C9149|nr:uncharacterized protein LOC120356169 isoform X2 [Nilaparvata lugens]
MLESILKSQNQNTDPWSNQQHDEINFDPARLPMKTEESLLKIEEELRDNHSKNNMVNYLSKIGENSINDMTKRIMRRLIGDELAKDYSWFGAKGKNSFQFFKVPESLRLLRWGFKKQRKKRLKRPPKIG